MKTLRVQFFCTQPRSKRRRQQVALEALLESKEVGALTDFSVHGGILQASVQTELANSKLLAYIVEKFDFVGEIHVDGLYAIRTEEDREHARREQQKMLAAE